MEPPAKKQRLSKKPSTFSVTKAQKVVGWIPRSNLETILLESAIHGNPVQWPTLLAAVPESQKWRFRDSSPKTITKVPSRVGTGRFDVCDDELLLQVLSYLPLSDIITCVSLVCRGWRSCKTTLPSLFEDLSNTSSLSRNGSEWTSVSKTQHFLKWLGQPTLGVDVPDSRSLVGFCLSTTESCNPNEAKKLLHQLEEYIHDTNSKNNKKPRTRDLGLTTFVAQGPKIYESTLKESIKVGVCGPSLKKLVLVDVKDTKPTKLSRGIVLELLKLVPNLEELGLTHQMGCVNGIPAIMSSLMEARHGSPTIVRVLDFTQKGSTWVSRDHMRNFSWKCLRNLSSKAPELLTLKFDLLYGILTLPLEQKLLAYPEPEFELLSERLSGAVEDVFGTPLQSFACLKTFHLSRLFDEYDCSRVVPMVVYQAAQWLLSGMPVLESLCFGCGSNYLSARERKVYVMPTLPGLGGTLTNWPTTLKDIHLRDLALVREDLMHLPRSIEQVTMECCGNKDDMLSVAQGLCLARREEDSLVGVHEHNSRFNPSVHVRIVFGKFNSLPAGFLAPVGSLDNPGNDFLATGKAYHTVDHEQNGMENGFDEKQSATANHSTAGDDG